MWVEVVPPPEPPLPEPPLLVGLERKSSYWAPALPVAVTVGRNPDNARGKFSSVARTLARC
jgi:hypothetical protein